jgi:hypothetical protein
VAPVFQFEVGRGQQDSSTYQAVVETGQEALSSRRGKGREGDVASAAGRQILEEHGAVAIAGQNANAGKSAVGAGARQAASG